MRIYLAGPMRGIRDFNFPAFERGAAWLRARGHTVFSPAETDVEMGLSVTSPGWEAGGPAIRKALGADCAWICAEAEAIALLPGWHRSRGACAERALAVALNLDILYVTENGEIY